MNQNSQSGPNVNISGLLEEKEKREFSEPTLSPAVFNMHSEEAVGSTTERYTFNMAISQLLKPLTTGPLATPGLLPEQSGMTLDATILRLWFMDLFFQSQRCLTMLIAQTLQKHGSKDESSAAPLTHTLLKYC